MTDFPSPPPPPKWATYIQDRRPQFKMHSQRGHVRSAVGGGGYRGGSVRGGRVYEWDSQAESWTLLHDIPEGTRKSEHPFFLGTKGGPQDVEKMAASAERNRLRQIAHLQSRIDELSKGTA